MIIIGVDEVGRGPWAGPVVASSVAIVGKIPHDLQSHITDSKLLTSRKREGLYQKIIQLSQGTSPSITYGIGMIDNRGIDMYGIKKATKLAMQYSLDEVLSQLRGKKNKVSHIYIDGNDGFVFDGLPCKSEYIIKGDQKEISISMASILAKVFRDDMMRVYGKLYPGVGFENHKGYGTKQHGGYLQKTGKVTSIHRMSYKPIQHILNNNNETHI